LSWKRFRLRRLWWNSILQIIIRFIPVAYVGVTGRIHSNRRKPANSSSWIYGLDAPSATRFYSILQIIFRVIKVAYVSLTVRIQSNRRIFSNISSWIYSFNTPIYPIGDLSNCYNQKNQKWEYQRNLREFLYQLLTSFSKP